MHPVFVKLFIETDADDVLIEGGGQSAARALVPAQPADRDRTGRLPLSASPTAAVADKPITASGIWGEPSGHPRIAADPDLHWGGRSRMNIRTRRAVGWQNLDYLVRGELLMRARSRLCAAWRFTA